jgi:hypothetical protein
MNACPLSQASAIWGSSGIDPRKGTRMSVAICLPPPERKIGVTAPHLGQAKPLMFSTTPSTGKCSWRQNVIDAEHGRNAGAVDVHIQQTDPAAGHHQRGRQVDGHGALADPALSRQHHDLVPDAA